MAERSEIILVLTSTGIIIKLYFSVVLFGDVDTFFGRFLWSGGHLGFQKKEHVSNILHINKLFMACDSNIKYDMSHVTSYDMLHLYKCVIYLWRRHQILIDWYF